MKKLIFLMLALAVVIGFTASHTNAQQWSGTYVINGVRVQVNASHKNIDGDLSGGENIDTKMLATNYTNKALSAKSKTFSYSNVATCGNTTAYTIKVLSCTVTNKCSTDGTSLTTRSAACKTTTAECPCGGCTNGACKVCPGIDDPTDDPTDDPIEDPLEEPIEDPLEDPTEDPVDDPATCTGDSCVPGDVTVPSCPYPAADGSCPPPNITLTANPKLVSKGGSCNLNWKVTGADTCKINGVTVSPTAAGAKSTGPLTNSTVYTMTCTNGPSSSASKIELCSVQDVSER
jgi:hypothetical protein